MEQSLHLHLDPNHVLIKSLNINVEVADLFFSGCEFHKYKTTAGDLN